MAVFSLELHGDEAVEEGVTQATGERGRGVLLAELAAGLAATFEGALVLNEAMRIVTANAKAAELLGCESVAELVGRPIDDVADELGLPPLASRILEEGQLAEERTVEAPTERFLELRATITPSGLVVLVVRDITYERRRKWVDATYAALAKALAESTTYAEALHRLLGALGTALEWSAAELHQVDRERNTLRFEASWSKTTRHDRGSAGARKYVVPAQGALGTAWAKRRPVWLEDIGDDPCLKCRGIIDQSGFKSALIYPVPVGGEIVGVLVFFSERRRKCDPDIICLLTALDPVIGQFLERLRLFEAQNQLLMERERGLDRLKVLHSVTTALAEAVTIEEVGRVVLSASIEAANASSTVLYLLDPDRNELWLVDSIGFAYAIRPEHQRFRVTEVKGPLIDAIVERRPILVQNRAEMAARYPDLYKAIGSDFETWIALPCIAHDKVIGAMGLNFRHVQNFSDDDLAFYDTLAYQCALALDRARLFEAEHRAKEEALAERERFHSILMSAPIPVVVHEGPDHVVTMVNEAYLGILRRAGEHENIIGKPLREASSIMRDVFAQVATELDRVYESGQALNVPEYPVLLPTPDGKTEVHYLAASAQPLRDAQGNVTGIVQLLVDITDQVLARKRQEAARAEAEAETRAKDQFLAMLSHELRTPLQAILGWTQLLLSRPFDPKTLRRGLETIERNTRQQVRLIEQLLDVSRIVAGKLSVEPRPLDLAELVETSLESLRTEAQKKRILLRASYERPVPVHADPDRLRQVVFNLVGNALKFTPSGGCITVTVGHEGSNAVLSVKDTGQGIPPDQLPHIFQPFRQLEAGAARQRDGLGLGLSIVRHVVEHHGGSVRAESEGVGHGATFIVTLPLLEGVDISAGRETTPNDELREAIQGVRVLLIDDDLDTAEVIALALNQFGVEVNIATSADEAIEQYREHCCDLIISDLAIGDTDGFEVIRRLRRIESGLARRRSLAIALTGMATREDHERALHAGYDAHLAKPVAPDDLVRVIKDMVQGSDVQRASPGEDAKKP